MVVHSIIIDIACGGKKEFANAFVLQIGLLNCILLVLLRFLDLEGILFFPAYSNLDFISEM